MFQFPLLFLLSRMLSLSGTSVSFLISYFWVFLASFRSRSFHFPLSVSLDAFHAPCTPPLLHPPLASETSYLASGLFSSSYPLRLLTFFLSFLPSFSQCLTPVFCFVFYHSPWSIPLRNMRLELIKTAWKAIVIPFHQLRSPFSLFSCESPLPPLSLLACYLLHFLSWRNPDSNLDLGVMGPLSYLYSISLLLFSLLLLHPSVFTYPLHLHFVYYLSLPLCFLYSVTPPPYFTTYLLLHLFSSLLL